MEGMGFRDRFEAGISFVASSRVFVAGFSCSVLERFFFLRGSASVGCASGVDPDASSGVV